MISFWPFLNTPGDLDSPFSVLPVIPVYLIVTSFEELRYKHKYNIHGFTCNGWLFTAGTILFQVSPQNSERGWVTVVGQWIWISKCKKNINEINYPLQRSLHPRLAMLWLQISSLISPYVNKDPDNLLFWMHLFILLSLCLSHTICYK